MVKKILTMFYSDCKLSKNGSYRDDSDVDANNLMKLSSSYCCCKQLFNESMNMKYDNGLINPWLIKNSNLQSNESPEVAFEK